MMRRLLLLIGLLRAALSYASGFEVVEADLNRGLELVIRDVGAQLVKIKVCYRQNTALRCSEADFQNDADAIQQINTAKNAPVSGWYLGPDRFGFQRSGLPWDAGRDTGVPADTRSCWLQISTIKQAGARTPMIFENPSVSTAFDCSPVRVSEKTIQAAGRTYMRPLHNCLDQRGQAVLISPGDMDRV